VATCWYENLLAENYTLGYLDPRWKALSDEEIVRLYAVDGYNMQTSDGEYSHYWPCTVIERIESDEEDSEKEDNLYLVRIFPPKYHPSKEKFEGGAVHLLLVDYPRSSIKYVTLPSRQDQHLPQSFRHHIGIPEEMFPRQWKNINNEEDS
jgi:hypothetical protein